MGLIGRPGKELKLHNPSGSGYPGDSALLSKVSGSHTAARDPEWDQLSPAQLLIWINQDKYFIFHKGEKETAQILAECECPQI